MPEESVLSVAEIFMSIQGESTAAGLPCAFVRLAGCNLRCVYCDTSYAWESGTSMTIQEITDRLARFRCGVVEVTGGEPLLQDGTPLLLEKLGGMFPLVLVETNGSLPLPPLPRPYRVVMDIKCPGSGSVVSNDPENISRLQDGDEVKFVLCDHSDFIWAIEQIRGLRKRTQAEIALLMSPCNGLIEPAALAGWILESELPIRLQLQLHKIIWPHLERGV